MSILTRWSWGRAARAVSEALDGAQLRVDDGATVAVVDQPQLARLLGEQGRAVATVAGKSRPLKRFRGRAARASALALPLASAGLDALVGVGAGDRPDWEPLIHEWARAVREGGAVILVDAAERTELTRRALAIGLSDIEQRVAGGTIVTSGRVRRL